jgi:predicted DNA-binding protein (MmcQ/YjbR family)
VAVTPENNPRWARPLVQRFRALCLSLPDTTDAMSWNHPTYKVDGKTFAAVEVIQGRPSLAFRLDEKDAAPVRARADAFETPYGRGKWISLWADGRVNWTLVERLVRRSHRTVSEPLPRPRTRAPKKSRASQRVD